MLTKHGRNIHGKELVLVRAIPRLSLELKVLTWCVYEAGGPRYATVSGVMVVVSVYIWFSSANGKTQCVYPQRLIFGASPPLKSFIIVNNIRLSFCPSQPHRSAKDVCVGYVAHSAGPKSSSAVTSTALPFSLSATGRTQFFISCFLLASSSSYLGRRH